MENLIADQQARTQETDDRPQFYAQPYDIMAEGFYFCDATTFKRQCKACRDRWGHPVEEFDIQFIEGDDLDEALFEAIGIHQANIIPFMKKLNEWEDWHKKYLIIAVGECGYRFDIETDDPDDLDIDLYHDMTLRDLAYLFADEGMLGDVPANIASYLDFDAIARDLGQDYTEVRIAGESYVYRAS